MKTKKGRANIDLMFEKMSKEQELSEYNLKRYLLRIQLQQEAISKTLEGVQERLKRGDSR